MRLMSGEIKEKVLEGNRMTVAFFFIECGKYKNTYVESCRYPRNFEKKYQKIVVVFLPIWYHTGEIQSGILTYSRRNRANTSRQQRKRHCTFTFIKKHDEEIELLGHDFIFFCFNC